jgi:hypothetical protein
VYYGWNGSAQLSDGYFFSKGATARYQTGAITTTTSPQFYWLRSPDYLQSGGAVYVYATSGYWRSYDGVSDSYGFRPAGVLNLESAQCLLAANISLRESLKMVI